jgi:hypothetical protein
VGHITTRLSRAVITSVLRPRRPQPRRAVRLPVDRGSQPLLSGHDSQLVCGSVRALRSPDINGGHAERSTQGPDRSVFDAAARHSTGRPAQNEQSTYPRTPSRRSGDPASRRQGEASGRAGSYRAGSSCGLACRRDDAHRSVSRRTSPVTGDVAPGAMMNGKAAGGRSRQVDGTWLVFLAALPAERVIARAVCRADR